MTIGIMNRRHGYVSLVVFFICTAALCAGIREMLCEGRKRNQLVPIEVAGIELKIELATTPEEHMLGLMYRHTLGDNEGMLFCFPHEKHLSFWMKDTHVPLSIAFIKADGRIMQIESMKPYSLDTHVSREKVKYALEMKDGWFQEHKVTVGDRVTLPPDGKNMTGKER